MSDHGSRTKNRTVHAENNTVEVVRYDRTGKWYIESKLDESQRQHVKIDEVVEFIRSLGEDIVVHWNRPGGTVFDRKLGKPVE